MKRTLFCGQIIYRSGQTDCIASQPSAFSGAIVSGGSENTLNREMSTVIAKTQGTQMESTLSPPDSDGLVACSLEPQSSPSSSSCSATTPTATCPASDSSEPTDQADQDPATPVSGAPTSSDAFCPVPWMTFSSLPDAWQAAPRKSGKSQSPVSIASGLVAVDTWDPMRRLAAEADQPQSDEEWAALFHQSFDDLPSPLPGQARSAFLTRIEVERCFFSNRGVHASLLPAAPSQTESGDFLRFQFRYANRHFALATSIVHTPETEKAYRDMEAQSRRSEALIMNADMKRRAAQADTPAECQQLIASLEKVRDHYLKSKDRDSAEMAAAWIQLVRVREAGLDGEQPVDAKPVKTVARPAPVVTVTPIGPLVGGIIPHADVEAVVPPLEQGLLPAPIVQQTDGGQETRTTRFDWIADTQVRARLMSLGAAEPALKTSRWRPVTGKLRVCIPCAFSGHDDQALLVDNERVRVLAMPSGRVVEQYRHQRADTDERPPLFKVMQCVMDADWIAFMGYRTGRDTTSLVLINRSSRRAFFLETSVCVVTLTLNAGRHELVLGMLEGTVIRHPLSADGLPAHFSPHSYVYAPLKGTGGDVLERVKPHGTLIRHDAGQCLHLGKAMPPQRLVQRGRRLLVSSGRGLHLFQPGRDPVHMKLRHNAGFDFYGNLLVLHKQDNSIQLVQLHDYSLEANVKPPAQLRSPDAEGPLDSVVIHPGGLAVIHPDGSRRVIALDGRVQQVESEIESSVEPEVYDESKRAASFLPAGDQTAAQQKKAGSSKKKSKKGRGKAKTGK